MKQPKNSASRRLARRLALTRNPLNRTVDRVDGAYRLSAVLLLLVVVGASTWIGLAAFARSSAVALHQRQQLHRVTVVLAEDVPTGTELEVTSQRPGVQAKWTLPDGSIRTGAVYTQMAAHRGDSVTVWMNAFDDPVHPPISRGDLVVRAILRALVWSSLSGLVLWTTYALAQRQLTRRRDAAWTREWLMVSGGGRDRSL